MKIIVDDKLTYECDFDIKVGDIVVIPSPWYMEFPTTKGRVTQLGSSYSGSLIKVISVEK